jgi:hypothetical protein
MDSKEIEALVKSIITELQLPVTMAVAGSRLPTFDISAASNCCEGHCPCDSRNGGQCPCNTRCACDGKVAVRNELDWLSQVARLPQEQIKSVLEAAPIIEKVRFSGRLEQLK